MMTVSLHIPALVQKVNCLFLVAVVIGFEVTSHTISESIETLEVYVRVFNPPDDQPLVSSVDLVIQSVAGSASKIAIYSVNMSS